MLNYFILYLACFIEAFILYFYFNANYNCKFKPPVAMLIAQGFYLVAFLPNLIVNNIIINISVFSILTFLYAIICFEISVKSSIFHTVIFSFIMSATEMITEVIIAYLFDNALAVLLLDNKPSTYFIGVMLSKALMFIVIYFVATILSYKKNKAVGSMNKTYLMFLFPVTVYGLILIIFRIILEYNLSKKMLAIIFVATGVSVVLCCLTAIYNQRIQKRENELAELEKQQMKNEIDMQYLDLLEKKNQQMQILTHDYKNHLATIRELGDNEQVAEYIDKMTDEIKSSNSTSHSGNHTFDIIINKYVTECELKHISFDFDTKLTNLGFVDDFDLVTILGNVLDNALEAAEKSTDKNITLSTKKVNTYDTVVIKNSCDTAPDKNLKTKKQKGTHGLGLKSVEKTIKKYSGDFEWEYNETDKTFTITIMLLNKEG